MHNDKKFRRLYDKKMTRAYVSNIDRLHYDRAYVKKLDVSKLPFKQGSRDARWHDDWSNDCKRNEFVDKWIEHQVGRNANDVYSEYCRFGWKSIKTRDELWRRNVSKQKDNHKRYGPDIYIDENGNLSWINSDPRQKRRLWHRNRGIYVPDYVTTHNSNQRVPEFGAVREKVIDVRRPWDWREPDGHLTNLGSCMKKLPGKWYVRYKEKYLLLSVYVFPTKPYARDSYGWTKEQNDIKYQKRKNEFESSFRPCSVYTKNGILTHNHYAEYIYQFYDYDKDDYMIKTSIGNLGYGTLYTYISVVEAENELWKITNKEV